MSYSNRQGRTWDDSASGTSEYSQNNHTHSPLVENPPTYDGLVRSTRRRSVPSLSSGSGIGVGPVQALRRPIPAKRSERYLGIQVGCFHGKVVTLSVLEALDGASRGIGGVIRTFPSLTFNHVLVSAIVLHLGLIAIQSAAQIIVKTATSEKCIFNMSNIANGTRDQYLVEYGVRTALQNYTTTINVICQPDPINCTLPDVYVPHTVAECQPGSYQPSMFSSTANSYYGGLPAVFNAASMYGRTAYDLGNASLFHDKTMNSNYTYDRDVTRYFDDQSFGDSNIWGPGSSLVLGSRTFTVDGFLNFILKHADLSVRPPPGPVSVLSLILLVPVIWWAVIWILSLYYLDVSASGITSDDNVGQVTFGWPSEVKPITEHKPASLT
ncbi:hypothetical protein BCR43DRAFT_518367 [Syncephalastrum racemosum]|uniref:Uncharacterized protein n=1 Tax=Syncephalastrum racemosum TaxID=13706 RepID=A0A1X2H0P0_SYNRA|nr:hypothetical protein BCR43DRAFT_518367 [Syncephalastrum racemosum]